MKKKTAVILYLLVSLILSNNLSSQIQIVSGLESEIYHQFANDINNNTNEEFNIIPTRGSVENFNRLVSDSIHIAFMQYDVLLYKELENSYIKEYIKILLPLYDEEIHLISKNNNDINCLRDLSGKRVAIGSEGAGSYITANFIKLKTGIEWDNYAIQYKDALSALINDSIDAFFYVGAAPANVLSTLSSGVKDIIKLVPIQDATLDDIYKNKTIAANTYSWLNKDINTYSVKSLLVVNSKNLNESTIVEIDLFYNDLIYSLPAIQKNKLSHRKWNQVDFSDLNNIDWPVFKQEYISVKLVFNLLAYVAAILTFIQIYLMINKLWKRKHEKVVAESISISALFISFAINSFFGFKNAMNFGFPQLFANSLWIMGGVISFLIGIGFWVSGSNKVSLWKLFLKALKLESQEVGDLAKAFFKPSGADKIMKILGQIAIIDNELDEREKDFIQHFADAWGIEFDWDILVEKMKSGNQDGYANLRKNMILYLSTNPPPEQASQLGDTINMLINIDDEVTKEEELISAELLGLIGKFLGKEADIPVFNIAVVPQNEDQCNQISSFKDLTKMDVSGGNAYLSESFYSKKYAHIVCEEYQEKGYFSVVLEKV